MVVGLWKYTFIAPHLYNSFFFPIFTTFYAHTRKMGMFCCEKQLTNKISKTCLKDSTYF